MFHEMRTLVADVGIGLAIICAAAMVYMLAAAAWHAGPRFVAYVAVAFAVLCVARALGCIFRNG